MHGCDAQEVIRHNHRSSDHGVSPERCKAASTCAGRSRLHTSPNALQSKQDTSSRTGVRLQSVSLSTVTPQRNIRHVCLVNGFEERSGVVARSARIEEGSRQGLEVQCSGCGSDRTSKGRLLARSRHSVDAIFLRASNTAPDDLEIGYPPLSASPSAAIDTRRCVKRGQRP